VTAQWIGPQSLPDGAQSADSVSIEDGDESTDEAAIGNEFAFSTEVLVEVLTEQHEAAVPARLFTVGPPGRSGVEIAATQPRGSAGVPDAVCDSYAFDASQLRAASVRGRGHRRSNTPRQDSYSIGDDGTSRVIVLAVADGVGAEALSHRAAQRASATAVAESLRQLTDDPEGQVGWGSVFSAASDAIHAESRLPLDPLGDEVRRGNWSGVAMSTTLTVAICRRATQGWHYAIGWVGDSPAWIINPPNWRLATGTKNTDSAGMIDNAAKALPRSTDEFQQAVGHLAVGDILAVMTDGVGDPIGQGDGLVAQRLGSWWRQPPDQFTFAAQVDFARQTFTDDRTCVALWSLD
jgi:hypothetical protein